MTDLSLTIAPKSDQLNADDLIGRELTIKITGVSLCAEPDQPIAISFEGDNGRPYKPCKTMRRVLVTVWGPDGATYVGRQLRLYRDEEVQYGGMKVGGIRISHMSHITRDWTMALTAAKARRKPYIVHPLVEASVTETTERKPRSPSVREWLAKLEMDLVNAKTQQEAQDVLADAQDIGNKLQNGARDKYEDIRRKALVRFPPSEPPEIEGEQWAAA